MGIGWGRVCWVGWGLWMINTGVRIWEYSAFRQLVERQQKTAQTTAQQQEDWLLVRSSGLGGDYFWNIKGRKCSLHIYFVNLRVTSITSKWIAAAQPTTPSAITLGFLFHVDNKLGECDLWPVYFNSLNLKRTTSRSQTSQFKLHLHIRSARINLLVNYAATI